MQINSAVFDRSAPTLEECPDESLPEFAFIGRSNVGKSSLLNMLCGRRELARVSPIPGYTKLINMFTINQRWRLVDLPGYGFAQGAKKDTARFNKAVADYLRRRPNLSCIFALVDSRLEPQEIDLEFIQWLIQHQLPFVLVFTKTDKVAGVDVEKNIAAFREKIAPWFVQPPKHFTCSSHTGAGREDLLNVVAEILAAIEAQATRHDAPAAKKPKPAKRRVDLQRPW